MGNGDLIPALEQGGYSNITMLVETLWALIFLLLWYKTGKKVSLTNKVGKNVYFWALL